MKKWPGFAYFLTVNGRRRLVSAQLLKNLVIALHELSLYCFGISSRSTIELHGTSFCDRTSDLYLLEFLV